MLREGSKLAKPEPEFDVTVISRDEVTTFPKIAQPVIIVQVTYVGAGLPPATVFIEKDKYTPEFERRTIREDIQRRLKTKPESFRV